MKHVKVAVSLIRTPKGYAFQRRSPSVNQGNRLGLFGGKLEPGETPLDAVVREMREETSLDLCAEDFTHIGEAYVEMANAAEDTAVTFQVFTATSDRFEFDIFEGEALEVIEDSAMKSRISEYTPGTAAILRDVVCLI